MPQAATRSLAQGSQLSQSGRLRSRRAEKRVKRWRCAQAEGKGGPLMEERDRLKGKSPGGSGRGVGGDSDERQGARRQQGGLEEPERGRDVGVAARVPRPSPAPPPSRSRRSANMKRLCRGGSSGHCISELCAPRRASGLGLGSKGPGRDAERPGCGSEPRADRGPTAPRERAPRSSPALRPPGMGRAAA